MSPDQQEKLHALCLCEARKHLSNNSWRKSLDYRDVATEAYLRCVNAKTVLDNVNSPQGRVYVRNTIYSVVVDMVRYTRSRPAVSLSDAHSALTADPSAHIEIENLVVDIVLEDVLRYAPANVRTWMERRMSGTKGAQGETFTSGEKSAIYRWLSGCSNLSLGRAAREDNLARLFALSVRR